MRSSGQRLDARNASNAIGALVLVVIAMSIYAYIRLTSSGWVLTAAIALLTMLEIARILLGIRTSSKLEIAFDAAFFVVLLSVILGAYRTSLAAHPLFLFATVSYRPNYMRRGNRRLALVLSLVIVACVLPVTFGLVTDASVVRILTLLYVLFVLSLWIFCSRLSALGTTAAR